MDRPALAVRAARGDADHGALVIDQQILRRSFVVKLYAQLLGSRGQRLDQREPAAAWPHPRGAGREERRGKEIEMQAEGGEPAHRRPGSTGEG